MSYGKVSETYWHDHKIRSLSDDGRFFMLYLLTGPHRNRIGCFVLDPHYAAADMIWDVPRVEAAMRELLEIERISWDAEARVVLIRRHFAHNTLENTNVAKGARSDLDGIPDTPLLRELLAMSTSDGVAKKHFEPYLERLKERVASLQDDGSHNRLPNGLPNGSGNGSQSLEPVGQSNRYPNGLGNRGYRRREKTIPVPVPVAIAVGEEHTHSRPPDTGPREDAPDRDGDGTEKKQRGTHPAAYALWHDGGLKETVLDAWHLSSPIVALSDGKMVGIGLEECLFSDLLWVCETETGDRAEAKATAEWLVRESRKCCGWDDGEPRTLYWLLRPENFAVAKSAYLAALPARAPIDFGVTLKTIPDERRAL